MKNVFKQLGSLILPISASIIIPWFLLEKARVPLFEKASVLRVILFGMGVLLIIIGLFILILTVRTFILIGKGTLAPWSPTSKLIVSGIYAYVRNPMISGVLAILLGEALVFISMRLFIWFILFFSVNNIYFTVSEEPGLIKRFGKEYEEYRKSVPRWIPKL